MKYVKIQRTNDAVSLNTNSIVWKFVLMKLNWNRIKNILSLFCTVRIHGIH